MTFEGEFLLENTRNNKRILVVAPHPDDEVIGCGGTLAKYAIKNIPIFILYMMSREPSLLDKGLYDYELESQEACETLGVQQHMFMNMKSRAFNVDDQILRKVVKVLRDFQPSSVYIPHLKEIDREHRLVTELLQEAIWMTSAPYFPECGDPIDCIKSVFGYEVWTPIETPQWQEDITQSITTKLEALRMYKSQIVVKRYDDATEGLNRYRGEMTGIGQYAEVFTILSLKE